MTFAAERAGTDRRVRPEPSPTGDRQVDDLATSPKDRDLSMCDPPVGTRRGPRHRPASSQPRGMPVSMQHDPLPLARRPASLWQVAIVGSLEVEPARPSALSPGTSRSASS